MSGKELASTQLKLIKQLCSNDLFKKKKKIIHLVHSNLYFFHSDLIKACVMTVKIYFLTQDEASAYKIAEISFHTRLNYHSTPAHWKAVQIVG